MKTPEYEIKKLTKDLSDFKFNSKVRDKTLEEKILALENEFAKLSRSVVDLEKKVKSLKS